MIHVINKKCYCGKRQPSFNFENYSNAICCSKCKLVGMIDIKNKKKITNKNENEKNPKEKSNKNFNFHLEGDIITIDFNDLI